MEHAGLLADDPELQDLERARCATDVVYWVETWAWTYDPREAVATVPMTLWPKQVELLLWLQERERAREDGLVEKSRDTGATWVCGAYALHGWLFRDDGFACGFGSRKLDLVDKLGDLDSIFEKVRFLLRNLPDWMLPPGFSWERDDNYARLLNPDNGNSITGEGGDGIGRGGRKSLYFVDEAAFLERPALVDRSLSATTEVRIDVSTPNGPGNTFAQKRFGDQVPVFTLHYRDDPRKTPEWIERKKAETDPVTWAQEREIDYSASVEGICIPAAWVRAAVGLDLPESGPVVCGLDPADEGKDLNALATRRGPVVRRVKTSKMPNTTQTAWWACDEAEAEGASCVFYDPLPSGIKGTWAEAKRRPKFRSQALNMGESPTDAHWPDGLTSKEKFLNLRAELWWRMRGRFEKAFEHVEHGTTHRPEDMITIPNDSQLIAELSTVIAFRTENGKIKLESKESMRRRGIKSPDRADALALTMLPPLPAPTAIGTPQGKQRFQAHQAPAGVFLS